MADTDGAHLALAIAGGVLLIVHSAKTLQWVFCGRNSLSNFLRSLWSELGAFFSNKNDSSKLEEEVSGRLRSWQTEQFRWSMQVLSLVFIYQFAIFIAITFGTSSNEDGQSHSLGQIVYVILGYGIIVLHTARPDILSDSTINAWFMTFVTLHSLGSSPLSCANTQCRAKFWIHFRRLPVMILMLGRMEWFSAAAAGTGWCVAEQVGRHLRNDIAREKAGGGSPTVVPLGVGVDFLLVLCTMLSCWCMQKRAEKRVRSCVEVEFLEQRQHAFRALLKNFYDVVLELDTELRIIGPAQELAVFLLHGAGVSFEGRQFQDFLKEEDREVVVDRLQLPSNGQRSIAEVVHAQMRGVERSTLEAELFCFGFEGLGGGTCYVIGIREYSDEMHGVPKAQEPPPVAADPDPEEVAVTVDTSDADLPIIRSSATFQVLLGLTPLGSSLRKLVCNGQKFSGWVQTMMNRHLAGLPAEPGVSSSGLGGADSYKMKFRPQSGVQTYAVCTLVISENCGSDDGEGDGHAPLVAKLLFQQIERKRCSRSARSGSSYGGSSVTSASTNSSGSSLPSSAEHHGRRPHNSLVGGVKGPRPPLIHTNNAANRDAPQTKAVDAMLRCL